MCYILNMRKKPEPGKQKVMRLEKKLCNRLEKYAAETGIFEVRAVSEALNSYLTVKGY